MKNNDSFLTVWSEDFKISEIYWRITVQYGDNFMIKRKV
jgi:hypothetical protein